jgi:F-type H+-transporting ATPase subunit b
MLIDPFTTVAQIVNFLILVALLKKFFYQPIIQAMEQREKTISLRLQEAEAQILLAQQETERYHQQQEQLQQKQEELLQEAQQEAQTYKEVLLDQVQAEVNQKQAQWYEALQQNQELLLTEFRQQASQQLMLIARRTLADLGNANLEEQIITTFINRLQNLESLSLGEDPQEKIVIRSSFALTLENQNRLREVLESLSAQKLKNISFEVTPETLCGIELRTQGYKMAWNLGQYLDELEGEIKQSLAKVEQSKIDSSVN